jgi:glucan-binding YG repeat protein/beta-N-acetylglucosaminidase
LRNYTGGERVKKVGLCLGLSTVLAFSSLSPGLSGTTLSVSAQTAAKWSYQNGHWYYYNTDGSKKTGWLKYNNKWYYMDSAGIMKTGWVKYKQDWYFMDSSGTMKTGWVKYNQDWYFMDSSGVMKTGWVKYNQDWYFMDSSGAMKTGWIDYKGHWYNLDGDGVMRTGWFYENYKWYYFASSGEMFTNKWINYKNDRYFFSANGVMKTGWLLLDNEWFYFNNSGSMYTGWLTYKSDEYYFQSDGVMATGTIIIDEQPHTFNSDGVFINDKLIGWVENSDNNWYYYDESGNKVIGWLTIENQTYYLNQEGIRQTGWILVDNWYYFDSNGVKQTGWLTFEGKQYYLNDEGIKQSGWITIDNKTYYLDQDGIKQTGWVNVDSSWYFLNSDGVKQTGWITLEGNRYYLDQHGIKQTGWVKNDNDWFFLNDDGIMQTGWILYKDEWYYLLDSGVMEIGWLYYKNSWYFLTSDGSMQTGWLETGGKKYYLKSSGAMVTGLYTIGSKTYLFENSGALNPRYLLTYTNYSYSLGDMVAKQVAVSPQTDKYRNSPAYVYKGYVNLDSSNSSTGIINTSGLRVRAEANTSSHIYGVVNLNDRVTIQQSLDDWYQIKYYTWRNATTEDVSHYVDPSNFDLLSSDYYQFLNLSQSAKVSANAINNKVLTGKGILAGKGQAFINASNTHSINEFYLISHALLETGNGQSELSSGVLVKEVDGKSVTPKLVYNMFGIGAYDNCALKCGSEYAYNAGWFSPEDAIVGGAKFISERFVNHPTHKQNTLYKMRWNPTNPATHQYATDIGWSVKQVYNIKKFYDLLGTEEDYQLDFEIPIYK